MGRQSRRPFLPLTKNTMAVSVDTVYQRVLAILNKEQRGYVTPEEFNLFANQAQLDIFEQYFYDINQFGRLHGNDTEYSDMLNLLNEKISFFEKEINLTRSGNFYSVPSDLYRVGTIIINSSNTEVERVNKNEFLYYQKAPLTKSKDSRPIYIKDNSGFKVYGNTEIVAVNAVRLNYIKKPAKVIWNYVVVLGFAQYAATGSVDFELHPSEETELVIKILALCGLILKDPSVYQIATGEEVRNTNEEKS